MMYAKLGASLLASLVLIVAVQGASVKNECHADSSRLPKNVQPSHYALNIKPNLDDASFEGKVIIDLEAAEGAANKIVLHADASLDVNKVDLVTSAGEKIAIKSLCRDPQNSLIIIGLGSDLSSAGQLEIEFEGEISADMQGLYMSVEKDEATGATQHMAVTNFEPTHARRVFPCFDEPEFKATFDVTIEHDSQLQAIASTPVAHEEQHGNLKSVQFEKTPKISTFLLAFAVGKFEQVTSNVNGVTLGVYTPAGRSHLAEYALDKISRVYAELSKYFQSSEQPLKKIDFLAVDDQDSATGSLGLVSVAANTLLVPATADEDKSADQLIFLLQTVTRELVHQWVGNSVTMKWWDDLWVNKGLAAWLTLIIEDKAYPELENDLSHVIDAQIMSTIYDSDWQKSHPLKNVGIASTQDIENSIDLLMYYKSPSLFRMLNDYLGPAHFEQAIKKYLAANAFTSTDAEQLYSSLEQSTGVNVADMMRSWTEQAGLPLVSVSLTDGPALHVQQTRQKSKKSTPVPGADKQLWTIPMTIEVSSGSKTEVRHVLTKASDTIELPAWFDVNNPKHYIKVNKNFAGFYITHYEDARLFDALERAVRQKSISIADRLNVLSDTHALFKAGKVTAEQMERALSWFENEDDDVVVDKLARV